MLDRISIFLNFWGLLCVLSCGLFLKMFHMHFKRMCILLLWGESFYMGQLSPFALGHCSGLISLLIFRLEGLSIFDSGVLKSPSISVLLSIIFLMSSKIFLIYLGAPMLGVYMFTIFMSSWWILPLSIMKWPSESLCMAFCFEVYFVRYKYCYCSFFSLSVCLEYFFQPFTFMKLHLMARDSS